MCTYENANGKQAVSCTLRMMTDWFVWKYHTILNVAWQETAHRD